LNYNNCSFEICRHKQTWDDFVCKSPQNNIFCQTRFLDVLKEDYDLLTIVNNEGILIGAIVLRDKNDVIIDPYPNHGVLVSSHFDDIASHKKVSQLLELTKILINECVKRYIRVHFSMHISFNDIRSFQWHNYHLNKKDQFKVDVSYTGILDIGRINNFNEILKISRSIRRQEHKKCLLGGFRVEESDNVSILNKLHQKTFERQGLKRSKNEKFIATILAKESIEKGFGRLMICRDSKGVPAAASLFVFDRYTGYYLIGANDPGFRKYGTGSFLVLEQIRKCFEHGIKAIDFVGINSPNRGDFKTSFNARTVPLFNVYTVPN